MSDIRNHELSLRRSREAMTREDRPDTFSLCGREWDLLPEVFAPVFSPTTQFGLELLDLSDPQAAPRTGSLLEIGCGTGIIAVSAALAGCAPVVASDISPAAARNAAMNAERHGTADRVRSVQSDLFDSIGPDERFDIVFWHSNYVLAPEDYAYASLHERGYVDPGYAAHRRFLTEAPEYLTANGSVLLHFSARGDLAALHRIAEECERQLRLVRHLVGQEGPHQVEHMLLEVTRSR